MSDIIVRPNGNKWGAFFEDRHIVSSACKNCVIQAVRNVTKKSQRYKRIIVKNAAGDIEWSAEIGVNDAGSDQEG